jgi:hypothetical protein
MDTTASDGKIKPLWYYNPVAWPNMKKDRGFLFATFSGRKNCKPRCSNKMALIPTFRIAKMRLKT